MQISILHWNFKFKHKLALILEGLVYKILCSVYKDARNINLCAWHCKLYFNMSYVEQSSLNEVMCDSHPVALPSRPEWHKCGQTQGSNSSF